MGNWLPGKILYSEIHPDGPRLNKNLYNLNNQENNSKSQEEPSKNILLEERRIMKQRFDVVNDLTLGVSFGEARHTDWPAQLQN